MRYLPEPPFRHGTVSRVGVLLVNLGTPAAPTSEALRPYLQQFLSDPRVIEIPRLLWWPILHLFILTTRPRKSAQKYASIWTPEGSPLLVHTQRQATLLKGYLGERTRTPLLVDYAMRYGVPSIETTLLKMKAAGCGRLLILPLYPQYAASSTGSVFDAVADTIKRLRNPPELRFIKHFHDHPGYIATLAESVRAHWAAHGRPDRLIMSFHGVPRFTLDKGDPYHCECQKTARLLAESLGLAPDAWQLTFQSRFGRAEWLTPYTQPTLEALARQGVGRVDVICPGFLADCLETLEEIAVEAKTAFLAAGGREFHYIPCPNERPDWIRALADITLGQLSGWLDEAPQALAREAQASRTRALALGAAD
ncbi:ferrochelatase [Thiobacter aerophilum]|uniref:Ferrochelatase n=1 Tax=Thiobacter aerophilum TaxID=3121275 RepID=A0ABV0EK29_9BURK